MSKDKNAVIMPTDEEDKAITKAAKEDGTLLTDEQLDNMRPFSEVFPEMVKDQQEGKVQVVKRGRPLSDVVKERITIRLDPDVLEFYRGQGRGWQTKLNDDLREHISETEHVKRDPKTGRFVSMRKGKEKAESKKTA